MEKKLEEDVNAVTTAQHGKRPRLLSYNSPATSALFDPYFNDEICEEKVTDSLMSSRVSSPETNELFKLKPQSVKTVISVPIPLKCLM